MGNIKSVDDMFIESNNKKHLLNIYDYLMILNYHPLICKEDIVNSNFKYVGVRVHDTDFIPILIHPSRENIVILDLDYLDPEKGYLYGS